MIVSLNWLKELVEYKLNPQDLANKLSLISIGVKELTENCLELDLTYNRGDLLSLRGVAREIAAITSSKLLFSAPDPSCYQWTNQTLHKTPVEIEDEKLSSVQCIAKIEGLIVEPSNPGWVKKLEDSGIRSVNNLVDVTNLMMLEFGQPFHAFDAKFISDETIIVRRAKNGEEITTLDNKLRKLTSQDIVLADTKGAVDVGGIMGGKDTEIKESTHTILLSASTFNSVMVRKTSKKLGLYSEASKRFQHGLTKTNLLAALAAAIKMYESLGGKLVAVNIVGDLEEKPKTVKLTQKKLNDLLGISIDPEFILSSLEKLGFKVLASQGLTLRAWEVKVPYWRLDINIEEDLIEEVARIYGYDKIEGKPLDDKLPEKLDESLPDFIYKLKKACKDIGLIEVQSYPFYSTNVLTALAFTDEYRKYLIKIANPISLETEYLRINIWPNLVEVVGKNLRRGHNDIAIFEIGKSYHKSYVGKEIPEEGYVLSIALCNRTNNPLAELYKIAENLCVHLRGVELKVGKPSKVVTDLFHPNRFVHIEKDGKPIGGMAEVHLRVLNKLGIEKRVAVLEIEI